MSLIDHLAAQLTAFTVLRPEERESILAGRRPGQAGGLSGYLANHPAGVVQLEEAQPITSDGQLEVYWIPIACLAPTEADAGLLAQALSARLCGDLRDPGPYTRQIPDQPRRLLESGAWMCRPTFSITLLYGQMPQE